MQDWPLIVIRAGVIGLTSAVCLQNYIFHNNLPHRILLVANEFPSSLLTGPSINYASMWAGAHVRPVPASNPQLERESRWLKQTTIKLAQLCQLETWVGIRRLQGIEYLSAQTQPYVDQFTCAEKFANATGLENFRILGADELPAGTQLGFEYDTYCINPPMYCMSLLRSFLTMGGRTLQKQLANELEAFGLAHRVVTVVNASGMGFGDPECFPIRGTGNVPVHIIQGHLTYYPGKGQTCLVSETSSKTITRHNIDGSWTFIIPRPFGGGTIIGGTKDANDWCTEPKIETRDMLLLNGKQIYPQDSMPRSGSFHVIADIVGRRPGRKGGARVEVERRACNGGMKSIVHCYGMGSRGYEISWGVTMEVLDLVRGVIEIHGCARL